MTSVRALVTIGLASLWLALFVPPMFMWGHRAAGDDGIRVTKTSALVYPLRIEVDRGSADTAPANAD